MLNLKKYKKFFGLKRGKSHFKKALSGIAMLSIGASSCCMCAHADVNNNIKDYYEYLDYLNSKDIDVVNSIVENVVNYINMNAAYVVMNDNGDTYTAYNYFNVIFDDDCVNDHENINKKYGNYISDTAAITIDGVPVNATATVNTIVAPSVETINESAFSNCKNLVSVFTPEVTTIKKYAFSGCSSLNYVYTPKVTYIGTNAFYECSSLGTIDLSGLTYNKGGSNQTPGLYYHNSPLTVGNDAFTGCSSSLSVKLNNNALSSGVPTTIKNQLTENGSYKDSNRKTSYITLCK